MTFNSWQFLLFYPIVLLLYFTLPKKCKWPMLLIASYFFYMCYSPTLVFLIFGTTLVSWIASRRMEMTESRPVRRFLLIITLVVSLGVLFFYKYFDFLSHSLYSIFPSVSVGGEPFLLRLALPVGISFYTFQTLSYVIDVYRGEVKSEKNFFFYALFVSFFPQLVAGPIERPDNLIPQLREAHPWSDSDAVKGAKHMLVGFFKKICVADLIAMSVDKVYNNPTESGAISIVIATLLFAAQIYCDFSGYTDIAIGCARIMGIRLMKNFDHPYRATSVKEFWSRWHISLSSWFKDYLYIPLGGNRCSLPRNLLNIFIVFLVSGLWHGAEWTFVIWGALHGVYQIIGRLTIKPRRTLITSLGLTEKSHGVVLGRRIGTFILVTAAWMVFRANSISDLSILLTSLFTGAGAGISESLSYMGITPVRLVLILISLISLLLIDDLVKYEDESESDAIVKGGAFVYIVWAILLCWLLLISNDMISKFIYFSF